MKKHLNLKIFGRVQGVFFRHTAKQKADEFGLSGFARNEDDGSVYIEAEGEEGDLRRFIDWARYESVSSAKIERVEFEVAEELKNFKSFEIL